MSTPLCGSCGSPLISDGQHLICNKCGAVYPLSPTQSNTGTGQIDQSSQANNYLKLALSAYQANNFEDVEKYATKVLEMDPNDYQSWFLKGISLIRQSTISDNNIKEAIVAFRNTLQIAPEEMHSNFCEKITEEMSLHSLAAVRVICSSIQSNSRISASDINLVGECVQNIRENLAELYSTLAIKLDPSPYLEELTITLSNDTTNKVTAIINKFTNSKRLDIDWNFFTEEMDFCIEMLSLLARISSNNAELSIKNLQLAIQLEKGVMESYSVDFEGNKEYTFSKEALMARKQLISDWLNEIDKITKIETERRNREIKEKAEQYWKEHPEEKEQLLEQKKNLEEKLLIQQSQLDNCSILDLKGKWTINKNIKNTKESLEEINKKLLRI